MHRDHGAPRIASRFVAWGLIAAAVGGWGVVFPNAVHAQPATTPAAESLRENPDDRRCLNCHGRDHIATITLEERRSMVALQPGEALPDRPDTRTLLVRTEDRQQDIHRTVACIACHADADRLPHAARLAKPTCNACHPQAAELVLRSVHAEAAAKPGMKPPLCWDCHGTHDIRRSNDRASKTHPLNVLKTCADCHQQHSGAPYEGTRDGAAWVSSYMDSVHGRAVLKSGLALNAPTCAACHGHHEILHSSDANSSVSRGRIAGTCGKCHVGIEEVFKNSVHAEPEAGRTKGLRPPLCNDCHASHAITRADTPEFRSDIITECGTCHQELYQSYRESYHGQVQRLGSKGAARCSDCHGTHNIRRIADPDSTLHTSRRAETCAKCHAHADLKFMSASAHENFIKYRPHADFRNRKKDPILFYVWLYFIIIISVTMAFWLLHSIAWFVRGAIIRMREGPRPRHHASAQLIRRFTAWHRITHGLVIISFFGLTLTGLPLKFSDQKWAHRLMNALQGPEAAGIMHRVFAVMVLAYLVMHGIHLWRIRRGDGTPLLKRVFGPNSLLPMKRDWDQFRQMVRWFLGRGPKPKFDRWTYWEKFDYWADFVGTFIIGLSGLLLWFPLFFSNYLSGYWFNVATVVHGYEALLAVGFIFTIHFFNAHLRWEKFPVDDVIFTGRVPEAEYREERGSEYERLEQGNRLKEVRVGPAPKWLMTLAKAVAVISLLLGSLLVILIVRGLLH